MKKLCLVITLLINVPSCFAQIAAGLIAHWDMNGTPNDVSGNGHNGHANNLTPAIGQDGIMGHAWYFNGSNSVITIPYSPAFNITKYTIAATIKVKGFYSGPCHWNMIFLRGRSSGSTGGDWYYLGINDYPAGYGCTPTIDSNLESFLPDSYSSTGVLAVPSLTVFDYSPHIVKNVWYNVVVTFNDTTYRIFINNILTVTANIVTPGVPIPSGTDSAYIGLNLMEAGTGYPYGFKGDIDDVMLYNRTLTDSEIVHLHDTCGSITSQPVISHAHVGTNATYTVSSSIMGATYQWQQNSGAGFVNLSNGGIFSGVTTPTLTVTGVTAAMNNYTYRCLLSNSWGCADTTSSALLITLGTSNVLSNETILVYPNPGNNIISVQLPFIGVKGSIELINDVGQMIAGKNIYDKKTNFDLSSVPPGVYFIKIKCDERVFYKKVIKY